MAMVEMDGDHGSVVTPEEQFKFWFQIKKQSAHTSQCEFHVFVSLRGD
jgi:hypothetical protein